MPSSAATEALKALATVLSGLTIGLALLTPFLSVAIGQLKHMIEGL